MVEEKQKLNKNIKVKIKAAEKLLPKNEERLDTLEFVSHELKGILGSTIMCAYSIRDGFLGLINFKQRKCLDTAIRNLRRLETTIKDFIDISRITEGKLELRKTEVNLNDEVLREVKDTFMVEINEKKMVLENRIPSNLIIITDRVLITTVFNNLVSNAIKYGCFGGRIIFDFEDRENNVRLSVYNDGIPIKENDRESLFKKFSRLETVENKGIKGTGLGLFIVKKIIENIGGSVWFESREKGNEFIFEIEKEQ